MGRDWATLGWSWTSRWKVARLGTCRRPLQAAAGHRTEAQPILPTTSLHCELGRAQDNWQDKCPGCPSLRDFGRSAEVTCLFIHGPLSAFSYPPVCLCFAHPQLDPHVTLPFPGCIHSKPPSPGSCSSSLKLPYFLASGLFFCVQAEQLFRPFACLLLSVLGQWRWQAPC